MDTSRRTDSLGLTRQCPRPGRFVSSGGAPGKNLTKSFRDACRKSTDLGAAGIICSSQHSHNLRQSAGSMKRLNPLWLPFGIALMLASCSDDEGDSEPVSDDDEASTDDDSDEDDSDGDDGADSDDESSVDGGDSDDDNDPDEESSDAGSADAGGEETEEVFDDGPVTSDDFSAPRLDTRLWRVVDPVGDGTVTLAGTGTDDAHLVLSIPGGTAHDSWDQGNDSLRLMQDAEDTDFSVEAKFVSEPSAQFQTQGILVEEDEANYVRFSVHSEEGVLKAFIATLRDDVPDVRRELTIPETGESYLRLEREGSEWTAVISVNGQDFDPIVTFEFDMGVTAAGVFVGNAEPEPVEYTALVDYFFDNDVPIIPEDG